MLILTHDGPGFRSRLMEREAALAKADQLRQDPQYTTVNALESARAKDPAKFFVVCLPGSEKARTNLLQQFQQVRIERAEKEGPEYLWAPDPDHPVWHVLTVFGEVYEVDNHGQTCSCRDFGVCKDNDLVCKHLVAFERGIGTFVEQQAWNRLRVFAAKVGLPAAERQPVAIPVSA